MSAKHSTYNGIFTLSIQGRFDFSVHSEFRNCYKDQSGAEIKDVVVDLRNVEYMDSAALGMLLLLAEHFPGKRVQLAHANDYIRQILDIANFRKKFDIR